MNKIYTIFFTILILTSCEDFSTIVEIDLPTSEKKMAVHLDLMSGTNDTSYFNITKVLAENISDNKGEIDFDKAVINLKNETDGTVLEVKAKEFFQGFDLFYIKNIDYKTGDVYSLNISYPDLESITASAIVLPSPPTINDIKLERVKGAGTFEDEDFTRMTIKLTDLPGENYYRIRIAIREEVIALTNDGDTVSIQTTMPYVYSNGYSDDPSVYGSYRGLLISDAAFDGKVKEFIINLERDYNTTYQFFGGIESSRISSGKGYMYFDQISKERYNFEKSYDTFQETDGNPFGTPTKVFNNIENGYGIFSISTGQKYELSY